MAERSEQASDASCGHDWVQRVDPGYRWRRMSEPTQAALIARLRQVIEQEAPVWEEAFDAGPGLVVSVSDAATVIARYLSTEAGGGDA